MSYPHHGDLMLSNLREQPNSQVELLHGVMAVVERGQEDNFNTNNSMNQHARKEIMEASKKVLVLKMRASSTEERLKLVQSLNESNMKGKKTRQPPSFPGKDPSSSSRGIVSLESNVASTISNVPSYMNAKNPKRRM